MNTKGKKLLVSVVFQNSAEPPASLLSLGEVQGVARVKQAITDQVHLHLTGSTKFREEKPHKSF